MKSAQQLHQEMLVWDAHRDVAYEAPLEARFLQRWMIGVDLHLLRLQQGGINVQTFAICVGPEMGMNYTAQALKELDEVFNIVEAHSNEVVLVTKTADALKAKEEGKIAIFLNFEGAEPVADQLGLLRMFYRMGVRAMGLTWNFRNEVADGGYEDHEGGRLSQFGVQVIKEMNRLGMLVDLAHLSFNAMSQAIAVSEQPVIHSHGGVNAINPTHPRALKDDMLEQIAAKGGLFCVTSVPQALAPESNGATLARLLDAVDHCVELIGVDHVGLGADFDVYQSHLPYAIGEWTKDLEEADKWPSITAGLVERGYAEEDIRKIMGGNLLRLYRQVVG